MLHADEKIKAISSDKSASSLLNISKNTPLLSIERLSYTFDHKPIEWRLGLCLTTNHYYRAELE